MQPTTVQPGHPNPYPGQRPDPRTGQFPIRPPMLVIVFPSHPDTPRVEQPEPTARTHQQKVTPIVRVTREPHSEQPADSHHDTIAPRFRRPSLGRRQKSRPHPVRV
ncbi:hypothetical protein Q0Z83_067450 [Actinoplanes sichuanensis]|nr:hypothetical protein Q0Z83_067450 [Actinoplanes sichuanensis]